MRNWRNRASLSHWALASFLHSSSLSSSFEMQRFPSSLKQIMAGSSSSSFRLALIHVFWNLLCALFIIQRVWKHCYQYRGELFRSKNLDGEMLPPTSIALLPHILRANYITMRDKSYQTSYPELPPIEANEWRKDCMFQLGILLFLPRPVIELIKCGCKAGCKGWCSYSNNDLPCVQTESVCRPRLCMLRRRLCERDEGGHSRRWLWWGLHRPYFQRTKLNDGVALNRDLNLVHNWRLITDVGTANIPESITFPVNLQIVGF